MRKIIGILLLALMVYFIATQPQLAAQATTSAGGSVRAGADSLITFYTEMQGPTSPAAPGTVPGAGPAGQLPTGSIEDCAGRADGVYGIQGRAFTCPAAVPAQPPPVRVNPDGSVG